MTAVQPLTITRPTSCFQGICDDSSAGVDKLLKGGAIAALAQAASKHELDTGVSFEVHVAPAVT